MGWLTPRRSRSFAGSQGAEISRRGGGPSRVPARVVLLLLAMVAALAQQAFAQTTPSPGDRWTPGGGWTHDVSTTSLTAQLMLQQSVTLDGGSRQWHRVAIDACPWTKVTPPLPSTSCTQLKGYNAPGFPHYNPLTVNFTPTQAMIDNGGVVIRLRYQNYNSPAGGNVGMTEWVPLVPLATATLVLTPASISENGGVSTVTATLDKTTSAAVTVTVSAAAGAGAAAGDFALSTNKMLTIAAGVTTSTGTVTVTASNNNVDAPDKSVTVSGTVPSGIAAPSSVTLTITDDDGPPTVTLVLSSSSVSENGGVSTVTATLNRASSAATTITVSASPGTNTAAGNYMLSANKTLTIASGATTSAGTVTVTAVNDTTDSPDKSVTVSGLASNSAGVTQPSDVTLTITDDEALPTVTLGLSPSSVSESSGVSTVTATLDRPSSEAVTVTVAAAAGTGAVAADFTLSSADTLTIASGDTTSTGTVTVTANGNSVDSPDKSVTVSGTVTGGNGVTAPSNVTLTLEDDDALPTAALVLMPASISENAGVSTVTATLNRVSSAATTVTVSASPGAGTDFTLSSANTLTIAAGVTTSTGTVTVTASDNDVDAPDKSVTVSGTVSGGSSVAAPSNAALTITDDDALPTVTLGLSPSSVSESSGVSTVTATLSGTSSEAVTVTVAAAAGTGAVAADFTLSSTTTLTIASGDTTSTGAVTVTANGNTVDSPDKSVTVSGTVSGGNGVAAPSNVTLTLEDDEVLTLVLTPASISEDAGVSTVTATLDRTMSAPVTVTVSASPGAGTAGTDFTLSSANTLTIAAGATTSAGTVTITANDNYVDAPDKSVTVSGTATATGEDVEDPPDVTLTLLDDDMAGFVFEPSGSLTVAAGGAASTYTAKLSSEPTGAVTVSIASDNGDVTVDPSSLTFDATNWATGQTVTVTAAADDDDFADTATLSHRGEGGGYDGAPGALSAAVAGGGARIAASGGTRTGSAYYVVNGQLVTVTESPGVPQGAGVEIELPSDLSAAVSVTFGPVEDAPRESGSFSLEHEGASAMVDVSVDPVPSGGVELCLTPPAGVREAAGRAPGREVTLLHYTGGAWTAVAGSTWDESRSQVCAGGVRSFSPFAVGYANTKPAFDATTLPALAFTVDEAIDPVVTLPAATGGDGALLYALTPALPPGLAFDETSRTLSGTPTEAFAATEYRWTATDRDGDETEKPLTFTIEVKPALAEAGGGRIAASGGLTETRESVYVFNGHLVTVTEEAGVPPGVEIDLPSNLAEDVSVTFKPVEEDTPQESDSFSLEHSGSRVMVDVDVTPAPTDGVKLCLTPPAGMRETARRASGRDVELLHYTGGSWTAVAGSSWDESRSRACAGGG